MRIRHCSLLADLEQIVKEAGDGTVESLIRRLSDRVANIATLPVEQRSTLTEEIRRDSNAFDDHLLKNLQWSGWSVHPDFWRVRSQSAEWTSRKHFSVAFQDGQPQFTDKTTRKLEKNEKKRARQRTRSRIARNAIAASFVAMWAGVGAGMIYGISELMEKVESISSNSGESSGQQANRFNTSGDFDHYIVSADEAEKQGPLAFEVVHVNRNLQKPIPEYFNIADQGNFPWEVRFDSDPFSEPDVVDEVKLDKTRSVYDLEIAGHVEVAGADYRFGVLTLPGFRIADIEVFDEWGDRLSPHAYDVYELPNSGLAYLETIFADSVTYNVKYVVDDRPVHSSPQFEKLDKEALKDLAGEIGQLGAVRLSDRLQRMTDQRAEISLSQVDSAFAKASVYTYKMPKKDRSNRYSGIFADYKPYLQKGVLYYQCSGANAFLKDALDWYASRAGASFSTMYVHWLPL